MTEKNSR